MTYKPLDYWMICDRCGARYRRSEMREEWTGLWVCTRGCWEPRHPQDFVEGTEDKTTVPVARPDVAQTIGETTVSVSAAKDAKSITLVSASGMEENDPVGITLDDGTVFWTFLTADQAANVITINDGLWSAATSGNTVYKPSTNNETWVD
jgi:hypothetical protein